MVSLKIGVSACLLGDKCNFNGQDLFSQFISRITKISNIEIVRFCPEDFAFGSPRANLRILGGDGYDVLSGRAKVIDENGKDVTQLQIQGAKEFLSRLKAMEVGMALLMEGSPSCGSTILLNEENWPRGGFKRGVGVTAALLRNNGIDVIGSFDERTIFAILRSKGISFETEKDLTDLKDRPKFKSLFEA